MSETKASPALSVVIPCYNEESTLARCVERVIQTCGSRMEIEIIIVDDASRDGSASVADRLASTDSHVRVLRHATNSGKGAALRTGFAHARGDFVAIQDADLEYDPADLPALVEPLISGQADVVIGSRFTSGGAHRVLYFWHSIANRVLTLVSNAFTDLNLTDIESCYKVFRREVIQGVVIRENRFGFEPEIVAKVALRGLRIYEMGISYHGRTYEEGKKITAADGLRALYCILRYNLPSTRPPVRALYIALALGFCASVTLLISMILLLFQRG
jgi:dolichol-phosphate mannosyltransferase